jgi:L-fucose isomerase-like protein
MGKVTFGVIVGNRGFFPDILAKEGRRDILAVLKQNGYGAVALSPTDTKYGAVVSSEDIAKCAELFAAKAGQIDGLIITLPNLAKNAATSRPSAAAA